MTITLAQHTGTDAMGGTATNPTITYANAQTAGNLNVIGIVWGGAVTLNSVTDTQGNSYTVEASGISGFAFAYCLSIAAHAAGNVVTANFSGATTGPEAWLIESNTTTGSWSAGPVDHGSGTGTAFTTAGVTLTSQPTLGFAFAISGNGQPVVQGSGWTLLDALSGADADEWQVFTVTGTATATASQLNSATWDIVAAYFYTASSTVPTIPWTYYPDRIPAPPENRLLREAGFFPAMPPIAPTFAQVQAFSWGRHRFPDHRLARAAPNPTLQEWQTLGEPPIHPTFAEVISFAWGRQCYPERQLRAAANRALQEWQILGEPPIHPTFAEVVAFAWGRQCYPERVPGAALIKPLYWMHHERELLIERTATYLDADFPDRVLGAPPRKDYWTEVGAPERTRTYVDQDFPDRILWPTFRVVHQQVAFDAAPAPERTVPYFSEDFPAQVLGPSPRKDYASEAMLLERTATYLDADFPDRILWPAFRTVHQQAALDMPPAPERTSTYLTASFPDQVLGAPPRKDYWTEVGAPETRLPNDWYSSYPELTRAGRPVAQQRENAWTIAPVPERTSPYFPTSYPERFPIGGLPIAQQQHAYAWFPFTPTNVAPTRGYASYPDAILPAARARTLGEWTVLATPPILPTFADVIAQAWGRQSYPDRVLSAPANRQLLELAEFAAKPTTAPVVAFWSFPDQVLGAPPRKDYWTEVGAPDSTVASDWYSHYPEFARASRPIAQQQAFATSPQPERTWTLAATFYPDRVLGAPPRKDHLTEVGFPELTVSADWYASYPEIVRAGRPVAQQQAFASPVAPERTALLVDARYPEFFRRPVAAPHFTIGPTLPPPSVVTPLSWSAIFPEVLRAPRRAAVVDTWVSGGWIGVAFTLVPITYRPTLRAIEPLIITQASDVGVSARRA